MEYQNETEFKSLFELVKKQKPESVLEIGSMFGDTLNYWFQLTPKKLISIDLLVPETDPRYDEQHYCHQTKFPFWSDFFKVPFKQYDDSHSLETLEQVKQEVPYLDFLFIDGDHSYEGVKKDFELYSPLVKEFGIIAFHDIAINKAHGEIEVHRFWNEVKHKFIYREFLHGNGEYGIGVLAR